jgi:hypothetical protein
MGPSIDWSSSTPYIWIGLCAGFWIAVWLMEVRPNRKDRRDRDNRRQH